MKEPKGLFQTIAAPDICAFLSVYWWMMIPQVVSAYMSSSTGSITMADVIAACSVKSSQGEVTITGAGFNFPHDIQTNRGSVSEYDKAMRESARLCSVCLYETRRAASTIERGPKLPNPDHQFIPTGRNKSIYVEYVHVR